MGFSVVSLQQTMQNCWALRSAFLGVDFGRSKPGQTISRFSRFLPRASKINLLNFLSTGGGVFSHIFAADSAYLLGQCKAADGQFLGYHCFTWALIRLPKRDKPTCIPSIYLYSCTNYNKMAQLLPYFLLFWVFTKLF